MLVHDSDEQHLVQVKACHPDHNMQPVFTIQVMLHLDAKVVGILQIPHICILSVFSIASLHLSIACMQVKHAGGAFAQLVEQVATPLPSVVKGCNFTRIIMLRLQLKHQGLVPYAICHWCFVHCRMVSRCGLRS